MVEMIWQRCDSKNGAGELTEVGCQGEQESGEGVVLKDGLVLPRAEGEEGREVQARGLSRFFHDSG